MLQMDLTTFIEKFGYTDSPHFLRRGTAELRTAPDFGHIFRKATGKPCHLEGVYTLQRTPKSKTETIVPVVYVCSAASEAAAEQIHQLVWNQDVVPFILVHSPQGIRLYSGFRCQPRKNGLERGVLRALVQFNEVLKLAESFHADAIDSGRLWRDWGRHVTPETRIDWKLLDNLRKLDKWLRHDGGLKKDVSHALIGKYVYLHYLRDRDILSNDRLAEWQLHESAIFGRGATRAGLQAVTERLDDWLNGSIFPLKLSGHGAPDDELISRVAATFHGDEIIGERDWQLHLDFQLYNFSYIPIETLSVIYEQFLHMPEDDGGKSKGEEAAAYYTPIPVVNFMLSEMDEQLPLNQGMKVFDAACGSGAFLVQSYRRLIEREFPATKKKPAPHELRTLLEDHIFGIDNDSDACRVTELSLILTLLDYVEPPDLLPRSMSSDSSDFKLPALSGTNIFHTNFFKLSDPAQQLLANTKFNWIVGNPPWKDLQPAKLIQQDKPVWEWMVENKKSRPCGDNEVAQAFAWRVSDFLADDGNVALLLPAIILFENPSRSFRAKFFATHRVDAVANFSNLAEVLFAGRSRVPAAAFFYSPRNKVTVDDEHVTLFSPLVANQETTRPTSPGTRTTSWSLLTSANEMRDIPLSQITSGDGLPWKIAAWGSANDRRLIKRLSREFPSLKDLEHENRLVVSQGLELRNPINNGEELDPIPEVENKPVLNVNKLAKLRNMFAFPDQAISIVPAGKTFCRKGRGKLPLSVCRPPHIIVSAARNFAVFTDKYLIVPPRQIGIVSTSDDEPFLKALSLYLSSDFAFYHQFLTATEFGVKRDRGTLRALRSIPIPIARYTQTQLRPWVQLHKRLVKTKPVNVEHRRVEETTDTQGRFAFNTDDVQELKQLLRDLNDLVYDSLELDQRDRALVHDLVHVRLELNDGKVGRPAVRRPKSSEIRTYARRLKLDLDSFIGDEIDKRNQVGVVYNEYSGMVQVDLITDRTSARDITVAAADQPTARQLERTAKRLRKQQSQWVYFDRNLRIYEGTKTFLLKPMQRFHWTESQAMQDAIEVIAGTLQIGDE